MSGVQSLILTSCLEIHDITIMAVDILDELMSSQETVVLDEEEAEDKPIVNMESIHRVVSSSQSFCEIKTRPEDGMYS